MKLSLIVPCYNEAENVAAFHDAVLEAFDDCGYDYELVFIDDGSRDATLHNLKELYRAGKCPIRIVSFSRNFGKEAGLYAGLQHATGEYLCLIDADLQQPPRLVRDMVQLLDERPQVDIVAAYQDRRGEGSVLSFFKKSFYRLINRMSRVKLRPDASDFRTFRRSVAQSLLQLCEYHRFSKGLFAWVGYQTEFLPYIAAPRNAGKTKWSFSKLFAYAMEGIIGFSAAPLRLASVLGALSALSGIVYALVVLLRLWLCHVAAPAYAAVIALLLLIGGAQMLCLGIVGEYIGRTFEQSKHRPIYLAKEILE